MKTSYIYLLLIFISITGEIFSVLNTTAGIRSVETFVFRELVTVMLALLYYSKQNSKLNSEQKYFLLTVLIPLVFGFFRYIHADLVAIRINAFFYFLIYALWIFLFKSLGAELKISKFPTTYFVFIPIIFAIPFFYYFLVLFPILNHGSKPMVFLFALFASSTCVFVLFLPITKAFYGRHLIIFGIWLTEFTHMMQSYFQFSSEGHFIYPFARVLQTASYIFLIFGMSEYYRRFS